MYDIIHYIQNKLDELHFNMKQKYFQFHLKIVKIMTN